MIAGIYGVAVTGSTVAINSTGKLGVTTSSARFKEAIKPMEKASEAILALKPVTFRYKEEVDPDRAPQFGLVAEEVEKVDPELVVHDQEGIILPAPRTLLLVSVHSTSMLAGTITPPAVINRSLIIPVALTTPPSAPPRLKATRSAMTTLPLALRFC